MKPLPSAERPHEASKPIPGLPLNPTPGSFSTANRRTGACSVPRVYPWLLFASTAVAATFCLAYITKPVILADPTPTDPPTQRREVAANAIPPVAAPEKLLPDPAALPGDSGIRPSPGSSADGQPAASLASDFEETNIRVQHILDAESLSGDIHRIIVDVPVLYRSRNLRWTQAEAASARELLARLTDHQEKTRSLRDEGRTLLNDWNTLMGGSIPSAALRADSPSLPANQHDPLAPTGPAVLDTIETIQLSEPDK
jgi:hypothetical protein